MQQAVLRTAALLMLRWLSVDAALWQLDATSRDRAVWALKSCHMACRYTRNTVCGSVHPAAAALPQIAPEWLPAHTHNVDVGATSVT